MLRKILVMTFSLVFLFLMIPEVKATVYQDDCTAYLTYPPCTVWTAIDDEAHTFSFTYESAGYLLTPVPSIIVTTSWHIWDSEGYDHSDFDIVDGYCGTETFNDFYHTQVWTYCEVTWTFTFPVPCGMGFYAATAKNVIYVGSSSDGGGGGGGPYRHCLN